MNKDRISILEKFCKSANYCLVRYDEEFGKIVENKELLNIDLSKNEVRRSIKNKDDSVLFVYKISPKDHKFVLNPLQLLLHSLSEARAIDAVYPHIFNWVFDGLYLKAYATIPSNDIKAHSTITRYGGTENFYKILIQHLNNIGNMKKGLSPNYDFTTFTYELPEDEISLGSINKKTDLHSIGININDSYKDILNNSKKFKSIVSDINVLNMKYWAKEVNPDFISEAKHMKLQKTIPYFDEVFSIYPVPIRRLMNLSHKGNYNRFLIARFLLSVHSPIDAKHIYYSVLGDEERAHVQSGNCSTQWNYIRNNMERYTCPSLKELSRFIRDDDPKLSHVLEPLQDWIDNLAKEEE